jgi:cytochrome c oxidase cbb3-type subunit III
LISLLIFLLPACDRPRPPSAVEGERSVIDQPVRPVPGVGDIPAQKNPLDDDVARVEGRKLFVQFNCSGCHGGRAGGGMGPSLRDVDWRYGSTDAQIFSTINEGRDQGMPAWGTKVNEDEIWKLVAYIQSLRTPNEPRPPE